MKYPSCKTINTMNLTDDIIDSTTPVNAYLSAKYKRSFAYLTVKDRLPVILTQVVDHLSREKANITKEYGETASEEIKLVIGEFSKLKNELQTNKALVPLISTGSDTVKWNQFLAEQNKIEGKDLKWYTAVWLHTECYMYRRFRQIFENTESLKDFDPFRHLKEASLFSSITPQVVLGEHMMLELGKANLSDAELKDELLLLLKLSLWGNRCDLSFSATRTTTQNENPLQHLAVLEPFILVDDSEQVWRTLADVKEKKATISLVADNSGYEFFTDLCLADFLCTFSFAEDICFHLKAMPWFVSDTMIHDFHWILKTLSENGSLSPSFPALVTRWQGYLDSGRWTVAASDFWTLPYDFSMMQEVDPELYAMLSNSALVFFKGDLNYRKLICEVNWPSTETFHNALKGFNPTKLVALRTVKADLVCGLKVGQEEVLAAQNSDWNVSGNYGLIQFDS